MYFQIVPIEDCCMFFFPAISTTMVVDKKANGLQAVNRFMVRYLTSDKKDFELRLKDPVFGYLVSYVDRTSAAEFDCHPMQDNLATHQFIGDDEHEDGHLLRWPLPCVSCASCHPPLLDFRNCKFTKLTFLLSSQYP